MGPGPPHVALFTGSLAHYPVYQKSEKEKTVKKDKKKRKTKKKKKKGPAGGLY